MIMLGCSLGTCLDVSHYCYPICLAHLQVLSSATSIAGICCPVTRDGRW